MMTLSARVSAGGGLAEVNNRLNVVLVLGSTQTLAWASSYYLPAILADRMALAGLFLVPIASQSSR
jgi:hypothetical protein